ncbi:efflux RND transporter periplasmic adaptor subunit [Aliiroseovarius marinus]|uniref:efflux RND transporter periplasmic adaptor subunit n=1 Tax=Aliiroseovarius marinus TaxID=2500159 RepID=UPI002494D3C6|nr:HlyD family efflux transporter periplasmic adaptor subunit [Aliiroseovarius marinus]
MQKHAKLSRSVLIFAVVGFIGAAIIALLMPKPIPVDFGTVQQGPMEVTIVEEGRTSVRETYIVSTPVAGRLLRVRVHPGDAVTRGETVVARMLPTNPAVLDSRTREQAVAAVEAASAAVQLARASLEAALANEELANSEVERSRALFDSGIASKATLDRAESAWRASQASRATAEASIAMREAELANAQAILVGQDDLGSTGGNSNLPEIPLLSPIDGRILQVFQESETVLPAGAPIMEIGDIASDLEVIVNLISSDAVRVSVGDTVILRDWGQDNELIGAVTRVDPFGVTKASALGIEEQRVRVEIEIQSPPEDRAGLGHGYRLEAAIVVWQAEDVLSVPTSALFRTNGDWSVFKVTDGVAILTPVEIANSNGVFTELRQGLAEGDTVILYPSALVEDGSKVESR